MHGLRPGTYAPRFDVNIAYFVGEFPLVSETFILAQITGMIDRGHDVHIFASGRPQSRITQAIVDRYSLLDKTTFVGPIPRNPIVRVGIALRVALMAIRAGQHRIILRALDSSRYGRAALGLSLLVRTAPYIGRSRFDILHCQFGNVAVTLPSLIKIGALSGRLVCSFRGWDTTLYPAMFPGIYEELFSLGDVFLPVSRSLDQQLRNLGCPGERITVLHSGIDLRRFPYRESRKISQPATLITIGRLTEKKGVEFAIQAVNGLLRGGYDIEYKIVGDGPLKQTLRTLVLELALEERISFLGAVNSEMVHQLLRDADIFLAPSVTSTKGDQEGIPNSLKEAMAVGVPVIGTRHGGIPELIKNEVNGILVSERNPEEIAAAVGKIFANPDDMSRLTRMARKTIEDNFDIKSLNEKLEMLYSSLL